MRRAKRKSKSALKSKKFLLVLALVVAVTAVGAYPLFKDDDKEQSSNNPSSSPATSITSQGTEVNLNPPTTEEKQQAEDHKKDLYTTPPPAPTTASGKRQVTPVITSPGSGNSNYEVRAYVSGIFEEGGKCTATATKSGSSPITNNAAGLQSSNYTTCPPITLSGLTPGKWSVTVAYNSSKSEGTSQVKEVAIN